MEFTVQDIVYADAHDCLREIKRMVRAGVSRVDHRIDIVSHVPAAIERLHTHAKSVDCDFTVATHYGLARLEADWLHQTGRTAEAVSLVEPVWIDKENSLLACGLPDHPLEPGNDRTLLREIIWTLMFYAFHNHCTLKGEFKTALRHLNRLRKVIDEELGQHQRESLATRAIWNYFAGQCYLGLRHFANAGKHFLRAQDYAQQRTDRQLKEGPGDPKFDRAYEIGYNNVFAAQVLGNGLGRVAIHEGHLTRAEQLVRTSLALITGTSHYRLRASLACLLATCLRRREPFGTKAYDRALARLKSCFREFKERGDTSGERRCALELARGYLDLAEYRPERRDESMVEAAEWVARLAASDGIRNEIRYHMINARLQLVNRDIVSARTELGAAYKAAKRSADTLKEFAIPLAVVKSLISIAENNAAKVKTFIETELEKFRPGRVTVSDVILDPVREAECHLVVAHAAHLSGHAQTAARYFRRWQTTGRLIENNHLRTFAKNLGSTFDGPRFELGFEFSMEIPIPQRIEHFRDFLLWSAVTRFPGARNSEIARWFEVDPSTVSRWRQNEWLLRPPGAMFRPVADLYRAKRSPGP